MKITLGAVGGLATFIFGCVSMYFVMADRFEKQVTDRVSQKITMEMKIVRMDERIKSLESTVWTLQTSPIAPK